MRRSIWILATVLALSLAALGIMGLAGADEALAEGNYVLTVPGVGDVAFSISNGNVAVTAAPDGFSDLVPVDTDGDDLTFASESAGLFIEVESDDGMLSSEAKLDFGTADPGTYDIAIGDLTFQLSIATDGTMSASGLPDGYTVDSSDDHLKVIAADGTEYKFEAHDGMLRANIEAVDQESDGELEATDDESSDEVEAADQESDDDVKASDDSSDHDASSDHDRDETGEDD